VTRIAPYDLDHSPQAELLIASDSLLITVDHSPLQRTAPLHHLLRFQVEPMLDNREGLLAYVMRSARQAAA
jgi:hypothetical protein